MLRIAINAIALIVLIGTAPALAITGLWYEWWVFWPLALGLLIGIPLWAFWDVFR